MWPLTILRIKNLDIGIGLWTYFINFILLVLLASNLTTTVENSPRKAFYGPYPVPTLRAVFGFVLAKAKLSVTC